MCEQCDALNVILIVVHIVIQNVPLLLQKRFAKSKNFVYM